tara:strand:- start:7326 stop:7895 length:570 start_codon:yes stop_codon:yes gene_type:complete
MNNNLQIIYGPMFSGKTTKLIDIYEDTVSKFGKESCLAINYALDNRYGENKIISHDKKSIECYSIINLLKFIKNENTRSLIINSSFIFINEAQFFEKLKESVIELTKNLNKQVILCGLDLDYKKEKFGEILDLSIMTNKVFKLTGKCNNCNLESEFTHRVIDNNNKILIGSQEYIPLCYKCYNSINNIK